MVSSPLDYAAVKQRTQKLWASGDFAAVAVPMAIFGETSCEAVDLRAGNRLIDVACGSGTGAVAAARRF